MRFIRLNAPIVIHVMVIHGDIGVRLPLMVVRREQLVVMLPVDVRDSPSFMVYLIGMNESKFFSVVEKRVLDGSYSHSIKQKIMLS